MVDSARASVDLTLPANARAPGAARQALGRFAAELPRGLLDDAALLVSELVTNSVRHAATAPRSRLRLRVERLPAGIRVEVLDWGPGLSPRAARTRDEGGFGLLLVQRLATRWGIERTDTTCVWFELDRDPGGLGRP